MERNYRQRPRKRATAFWVSFLIFVILCAAVVALTLSWMWGQLLGYEKQTPQYKLNEYFTSLSAGKYENLKQGSGFTPDENSEWDDYFAILRARFPGEASTFSYRKTMASNSEEKRDVYSVYANSEKLGEVYLIPKADTPLGFAVQVPIVYVDGYSITAPSHAAVFVNGHRLDAQDAISSSAYDIFASLIDDSLAPEWLTYKTQPTLAEPIFTAEGPDGVPCTVTVDAESRSVSVSVDISPEVMTQYESHLQKVAMTWSDFTTKDATLAELQKYVYPETDLAKKAREFQGYWYLDHEKREFTDIVMGKIHSIAANSFMGQIDFTVKITFKGKVQEFNPSYNMAFLMIDGNWMLAGIEMATSMADG